MIRLTPQVRKAIGDTRKQIKVADRAASHSEGSEYVPTPPGSPTAQASAQISSESSEGSAESSDSAASTSPKDSSPGEDPVDNEVPDEEGEGVPQPRGVERTRNPEVWKRKFVSEIAYHKFREWWPHRKLILER